MPSITTYINTLRYLRPVQFYGRLWRKFHRPKVQPQPAPETRTRSGNWVVPAKRQASFIRPWVFRFLNEEHEVSDAGDWDNPEIEKLWTYNLHYFDDLNAQDADSRREWHHMWLERWVRENPPPLGSGWEPYPVSLRIVNWIKWVLGGNELTPECLNSLAQQVRWLSQRLEIHLLGNHLFANAKALVFAGLFFDGEEADRWLESGLRILEREIPEQILADGGQFERSTMYHALALEDMLDLCNVSATYPDIVSAKSPDLPELWRTVINRMSHWMVGMSHPDGEISFFNDAAIGIAPSSAILELYAKQLDFRPPSRQAIADTLYLEDSGYIRIQRNDMLALLDVAPVGPDYLPGHAHADTLSFELSLFGQRLIVNSGISQYGNDQERQRQRSTAAHNTVCIDGENSSEVWAGFRVAKRAYPGKPKFEMSDTKLTISCDHNGYKRLPGRCIHAREWDFGDAFLSITDRVTGVFKQAVVNYFFHPDINISPVCDLPDMYEVIMGSGNKVIITIIGADSTALRPSTWHPEFGMSQMNSNISASFSSGKITTAINWSAV